MKNHFNHMCKIKIFIKNNIQYIVFSCIDFISLIFLIISGVFLPKKAFIIYDLSLGFFTSLFIIIVTELFRNKFLKNKLFNKYKIKYILFAGAIGKYMNQKQWANITPEELYPCLFKYCEEMNSCYNTLKTFKNDENTEKFLDNSHAMCMEFYIKFINGNRNFNLSNFFNEKNYEKALSILNTEDQNGFYKYVIEENIKAKRQEEIENKLFEDTLV